jgi:hypothetical protein
MGPKPQEYSEIKVRGQPAWQAVKRSDPETSIGAAAIAAILARGKAPSSQIDCRSDRKPALSSAVSSVGCSKAAKCPPASSRL